MTNALVNIMFTLGFMGFITVLFIQLYNVMNGATKYTLKVSFILFIGALLGLGTQILVTMIETSTIIYSRFTIFTSWLFLISFLLLLIEIIINLKNTTSNIVLSRNSRNIYKNGN